MLIILVSFSVLASLIASMMNDYSVSTKRDLMMRTSDVVYQFLERDFTGGSSEELRKYINENNVRFEGLATASNYYSDIVILLADADGVVMFATKQYSDIIGKAIPEAMNTSLISGETLDGNYELSGIFPSRFYVYAIPLRLESSDIYGSVLICSSSTTIVDLIDSMLKTVVMSTLWVMLAVLIAVYFVSERITSPIKSMSRAAKSFSAGQFDVRVPVIGHDEIAELSEAFNQMAASLSELENMRRSFVANVSHDLRTPMTTISGFIDGILDGAIPPEKEKYYLEIVSSEVKRLSRLVTSLLDITRIQAGERKFTMTTFDICEMARQIVISFEKKIDEKHLNVEFNTDSDSMFAYADRDAIYQILYNICDNAVKFSKDGALYRVSVFEKDKKINVSVYNEGVGISPEDLPFVFDRFYKSDKSRGLDKSGVGLGLYIAKTIIDAHGEKIWVRSEYGKYCEFVFTLKLIHEKNAAKIQQQK